MHQGEVDVEAGEKDELLDKDGKESSDSNKKEDGGDDDLEEVKVNNPDLQIEGSNSKTFF